MNDMLLGAVGCVIAFR